MDELLAARYISLTTYKRDGSGVATPVWIAGSGGTFRFTTGDTTWKTRRLLNDPTVAVRVCDLRGRVAPGATTYAGTGRVQDDPASVRRRGAGDRREVWLAVPGHEGRRPCPNRVADRHGAGRRRGRADLASSLLSRRAAHRGSARLGLASHEVAGVERGERRRLRWSVNPSRVSRRRRPSSISAWSSSTRSYPWAMAAGVQAPAARTTSASKTDWFRPAVRGERVVAAMRRRRGAGRARSGSASRWCSRWARPKATWRASSWRARCATRAVTGSGAARSRKESRARKLPSPSTESRNDATAKSGSSSRVWSEARPAGARHAERTAAQLGPPGEDLDVAGLVGHLHGEELDDLAEVRVDAAEEPGGHDERGLLVLDEVGHDLDDRGLDVVGQGSPASQSTARAGSHCPASAWA